MRQVRSGRQAIETAFAASPDADIAKWKSPVLLIHADDDRNVPFDQTVELAHRLEQQHTPFEELVIPNDIHGFLRWASWLQADQATVQFLSRQLGKRILARPSPPRAPPCGPFSHYAISVEAPPSPLPWRDLQFVLLGPDAFSQGSSTILPRV